MPKVLGEITQSGGDFALLDSYNIRGGFMQVSTIQDRDGIIPDKLKKGMHVYVEEEEQIFEWKGTEWTPFVVNEWSNSVRFLTISHKVKNVAEPLHDEEGRISHWGLEFSEEVLFKDGDLIGWDASVDSNNNIVGNFREIAFVRNGIVYIHKGEDEDTPNLPKKYQTVYLVGSTSDSVRRCVMAIHPYHGAMVMSQFINMSLDNINTNYSFRLGQHGVNKWKIYGEDVYLKGTFIDEKGRNLSDLVTINQDAVNSELEGLRKEFGYDNLLENPYFIGGMNCWLTKNTATYFKAKGKFIMTNKTLLSAKRDGAYVIIENGKAVLRLINGFVTQKNENLRKIIDLDTRIKPYYVTLVFSYKAVSSGRLKVSIQKETSEGYKDEEIVEYKAEQSIPYSNGAYHTFKASFLWNGTGDFKLEYLGGEVRIQTIVIKVNEIMTLERKYHELFSVSDTLVKMAKDYVEQLKQ